MTHCPRLPATLPREATRWRRHARAWLCGVRCALILCTQGSLFLFAYVNAHAAPIVHTPLPVERDAIAFAVVAGVPQTTGQAPRTQAMLRWIAHQPDIDFIVHLGNLRTASDPCSDSLFASSEAVLNATPGPLIFVPGENDWATCATAPGGGDPVERLDALRESFFSGAMSLGDPGLRLIRQSELPAFRPYRENTRWIEHDVVFATLNVPSGNNHFSDAGGRNGEYEDREVANRDWIARAVTDAKRRRAKALVFFFQADPVALAAARRARSGFAAWFSARREHDGYAALRRDLRATAEGFAGPVLVVHTSSPANADSKELLAERKLPSVLSVEPLLRPARNGKPLHNLVRLQIETPTSEHQWLKVTLHFRRGAEPPSFHAVLEATPAHLPIVPPPTATALDDDGYDGYSTATDPARGTAGEAINASESAKTGIKSGGEWHGDPADATGDMTAPSGTGGATNKTDVTPSPESGTTVMTPFPATSPHATQDVTGAPVYDDGNDGWGGLPEEPHTLVDPSSVLGDISRPVLLPLPPQTTSPLGPPAR